jgi:hypothetical protein
MADNGAILSRANAAAITWEDTARKRRLLSATDPVADTLEFCARELRLTLDNAALEEVTIAEFARMHDRSEITVRRWCRDGLLGRKVGKEYRIRRGESVPTFGRKAS